MSEELERIMRMVENDDAGEIKRTLRVVQSDIMKLLCEFMSVDSLDMRLTSSNGKFKLAIDVMVDRFFDVGLTD